MSVNWVPTKPPSQPVARLHRLPRARPLKAASPVVEQIAGRVRAEYLEMPGLCLTREQACCLWALDRDMCDQVLDHLLGAGFLTRTVHGTFVRADAR